MSSSRLLGLGLSLISVVTLCACDVFISADGRIERARAEIAKGDYQSAVIDLKNALESEPDNAKARLLLAQASLQLGDVREAEKELRRAREAGAKPEEVAELTAETQLALGQGSELLGQIDSKQLAIGEPLLSIYRGEALLAMGKPDEAAVAFEAAQRADPQRPRALIGLARARAGQRQADEALKLLDGVPESSPEYAAALLCRGEILAAQGRFAEAQKTLQASLASQGRLTIYQKATLLAVLTESELAAGDINGSRASLQSLAQFAPNAPVTLILGARIAMATQDYASASAALQRVVVGMPDFIPARFLLGASLVAQGNLNQAESHLTRVVQAAPDNLEARKLLARVRLGMGRAGAALELLSPLQADTDSDINSLIGLAHLQLGDSGKAMSFLERSAGEGSSREQQLQLAATYLRVQAYRKAVVLLRELPHVDGDAQRETLLIAAVAAADGIDSSEAEMKGLLDRHPKDLALLNAAGLIVAQRGEFERARALLGRALAAQPGDATTLLNSARIESAAGDAATAAARLQGILAEHPDHVAARMGLAQLALQANDLRRAASVLEPLRAQDPKAVAPRLALARVYLLDRRVDDATGVITELDKLTTGNAVVTNAIGLLYLDSARYDEAATRFKRAIDIDGKNAEYWMNQARAQLALERRALARESLDKAHAIQPDSIMVVAALVMLDVRDGRAAAGAQRIAEMRKANPNDPSLLALEGDFYAANRDFEAASRAFDAALSIRPSAAISVRAYNARRGGNLRDAAEPLENWVAKKPDDFAVQAVLAEAYMTGGQTRRAQAKYEFLVDNAAPNAVILNNLAWLYYLSNDGRAEATAAKAYQMSRGSSSIADTYGWILTERGKVPEGLKILKTAEAGGGPDVKYHYASALARSGKPDEARRLLKTLLESSQSFSTQADARRLLQELSTP
jgi:putative PEP-CTERM system TPR-repeat lipoprotein